MPSFHRSSVFLRVFELPPFPFRPVLAVELGTLEEEELALGRIVAVGGSSSGTGLQQQQNV